MSHETELKLSYTPEALARLKQSAEVRRLARGSARAQRLRTIYFDTTDGQLAAQQISVRVRQVGQRHVLCVKAPGGSLAGLAFRREWETDIADDVPDLAAFPPGTVDTVLNTAWLGPRLAPVFETDFNRIEREVPLSDGGMVRLAMDEGEIRAGDASMAICEVELELAEGGPAALFELAKLLHQAEPAAIGMRTKAARGMELARGLSPKPTSAVDLNVTEADTAGAAFSHIATACIGQWLGNLDVVLADKDPEGIHQMRVALRRLRSAFRLFRDVVTDPEAAELSAEVRWLAAALGPARDWDVFTEETLGPVARGLGDEDSLAPLARAAQSSSAEAHREAVAAVASPRHTDLVLALGHWLAGFAQTEAGEAAAQPVTGFAARSLDRAWKRVRKSGRHLSRLSSEELHALRIEIKRLRYAVEFFAALHDHREVRGFLTGLKGMQDFLGHMNDLDVARRLMDELVAERRFSGRSYVRGDAAMARAEGLVIGWHAAGLARDRRHLTELWARVLAQEPYWR